MIRRLALPVLLATAGVASPDGGGGNVPTPGEAATQACPAPVMAPPVYPPRLRRRGIGGTTRVRVQADACGRVVHVELAASSGRGEIDDAAMAAARTWVFAPEAVARHQGGPLEIPITLDTRSR
jgi:TonB family protein